MQRILTKRLRCPSNLQYRQSQNLSLVGRHGSPFTLLGPHTVAPKSRALDEADCTTCPRAFLKLAKFISTACDFFYHTLHSDGALPWGIIQHLSTSALGHGSRHIGCSLPNVSKRQCSATLAVRTLLPAAAQCHDKGARNRQHDQSKPLPLHASISSFPAAKAIENVVKSPFDLASRQYTTRREEGWHKLAPHAVHASHLKSPVIDCIAHSTCIES